MKLLLPNSVVLIRTSITKTLEIADPHIRWETVLQTKGIHLPNQTLKLLENSGAAFKVQTRCIHNIGRCEIQRSQKAPGERKATSAFFKKLKEHVVNISEVRGNHDANLERLLPESIQFLSATGTTVGEVGLFHGHKRPSPHAF